MSGISLGKQSLPRGAELPSLIAFDGTGTDTPLLPEGEGGTIGAALGCRGSGYYKEFRKRKALSDMNSIRLQNP